MKGKLIDKFSLIFTKKISLQLFLLFFLICIIPFILIQGLTQSIVEKSIENKINNFMKDSVTKSSDSVSSYLKDKIFFLGLLSTDEEFIKLVSGFDDFTGNEFEFKDRAVKISKKLMTDSFYKEDISQVVFVTDDLIKINQVNSEDKISREVYNDVVLKTKNSMRVVSGVIPDNEGEGNYSIYLARSVVDLKSFEYLGTLFIWLEPNYLGKLIENNNSSNYYFTYIKTDDDKILSFNKEGNSKLISFESFYKDKEYIRDFESDLEVFNWKLINEINEYELYKELEYAKKISIIVSILVIVVMVFAITIISRLMTKPIYTLVDAMSRVRKGDFTVQIPEDSKNEFIKIEENFNYMIRYIDDLINKNEIQSRNLLLAYKKKKEAEIKALEAEINPHFLYNTLDSINWIAIENEEEEISRMLKSLGLILRYSLKDNNKKVLLKEDLKWLREYLYLQKQRFMVLFDYEIYVEDGLENLKVYKLIIQPLVENCILHAFIGIESGGFIKITYSLKTMDRLCISVKDNGVGLSRNDLLKIRKCIEEKNYDDLSDSLGIYNVIFRLYSYYGNDFGVNVISSQKGTEFLLEMPLE